MFFTFIQEDFRSYYYVAWVQNNWFLSACNVFLKNGIFHELISIASKLDLHFDS